MFLMTSKALSFRPVVKRNLGASGRKAKANAANKGGTAHKHTKALHGVTGAVSLPNHHHGEGITLHAKPKRKFTYV